MVVKLRQDIADVKTENITMNKMFQSNSPTTNLTSQSMGADITIPATHEPQIPANR